MSKESYVSLENLARGAAAELFEKALGRILENVADYNMPAGKTREITLVFAIKPDEDRKRCSVEVGCKTKMPAESGVSTEMYLGKRNGRHVAVEYNPEQMGLFDSTERGGDMRAIPGGKDDGPKRD